MNLDFSAHYSVLRYTPLKIQKKVTREQTAYAQTHT